MDNGESKFGMTALDPFNNIFFHPKISAHSIVRSIFLPFFPIFSVFLPIFFHFLPFSPFFPFFFHFSTERALQWQQTLFHDYGNEKEAVINRYTKLSKKLEENHATELSDQRNQINLAKRQKEKFLSEYESKKQIEFLDAETEVKKLKIFNLKN